MDNNFNQTNISQPQGPGVPNQPQGPGAPNQPQDTKAKKHKKAKGPKKSKKGLIIGLIILAVVVVLGIIVANAVKKTMNSIQDAMGDGTIVQEYGERDMSTYIDVNGIVESQNVEKVITTLQYPVEEIRVEVGDYVKAGDVVATINTDDIDTKIEELEAQASDAERVKAKELETASHNLSAAATSKSQTMDSANKSISEAKKEFEDADEDYYEKLAEYNKAWEDASKLATSTDAIASNPTVSAAEAALDTATDMWYAKQYAYDQATRNYSDTAASAANSYQSVKDSADMTTISNTSSYSSTASQLAECYKMKNDAVIIAQTSGVVTSIDAVEGLASTGVIMTIQDDSNFELNVDIKEKDYFNLKEGMEVEFSSSSLQNVTGKGIVDKINSFATVSTVQAGSTATTDSSFRAKLLINESTDVHIGMKLKARISTGKEMTTEAVAYTAIMTDSQGDYVYVAEEVGNGMYQVKRRNVDKGLSGDYYTQITGGELEPGELVISYPSTVTPESVITINQDDEQSDNAQSTDSQDEEEKDEE